MSLRGQVLVTPPPATAPANVLTTNTSQSLGAGVVKTWAARQIFNGGLSVDGGDVIFADGLNIMISGVPCIAFGNSGGLPTLGFFGAAPGARPFVTISGAPDAATAISNLAIALRDMGIIEADVS